MKRLVKDTRDIRGNVVDTFRALVENVEDSPTKILYDKAKSYLTYIVEVDTDTTESAELYEMVLSKDLIEVSLKGKAAVNLIFDIFEMVHKNNFFVSNILVGSIDKFNKWLKREGTPYLFSIKITEVETLTDDVVIFVASQVVNGRLEDIKFSIKGVMDV